MDHLHKKIIQDSQYLSSLNETEELFLEFNLVLIEKFYSGDRSFSDEELITLTEQLNFLISSKIVEALIFCSFRGLKEFLNNDLSKELDSLNLEKTLELSLSKYGCLQSLKYLNYGLESLDNDLILASENGHFKTVKYLTELDVSDKSINKAFIKASKEGHLEIVKYLRELGVSDKSINKSFIKASKEGHLEIVKFLSELNIIDIFDEEYHEYGYGAFELACINNHLEVAKFIYYDIMKEDKRYVDLSLNEAVMSSYSNPVDCINFLCRMSPRLSSNDSAFVEHLLNLSNLNLELEVIKILSKYTDPSNDYYYFLFYRACKRLNLSLAIWLYEHTEIKINKDIIEDLIYIINKKIERQIWDDYLRSINVKINNDRAMDIYKNQFPAYYEKGKSKMIEWLKSVLSDV